MNIIRVFVLVVALLLVGGFTIAQDGASKGRPADATLFHWFTEEKHDWAAGGLYAGLGLVGALITAFSVIGSVIPGTAGKARIDAEQNRLDGFYSRLSQLTDAQPPDTAAITALNETVDKLRDDLRKERWRQFWVGFVFYAILGAFFASALARDLVQAVVLGAGWTSFLGVFGLKSDYAERKSVKDQSLRDAEEVMNRLEADAHLSAGSGGSPGTINVFDIPRLRDDIKTARGL